MSVRTCFVKGLRLSLIERKAGRTGILLIHGNSSCKEVFAKQLPALSNTPFGIVVPDLPGHGGSDDALSPSATYSFPGYGRLLVSLMRTLGYKRYHIVGWSLGGHIGIEMWATDPAVLSLLISGTPPVSLNRAAIGAAFRWTATTALAGRKRFGADDARRYVSAMMGCRLPAAHHLRSMAARTDGRARQWMVGNAMAGRGVDEVRAVAESSRPLAILQGRADPFIRDGYLEGLRYGNVWKGSPVFVDAGHAVHWQAPEPFNAGMTGFLKDVA